MCWPATSCPTLALPDASVAQRSLTRLKDRFIKIVKGEGLISHGRHVTFQTGGGAIPKALLADILRLIARLRPPLHPVPT